MPFSHPRPACARPHTEPQQTTNAYHKLSRQQHHHHQQLVDLLSPSQLEITNDSWKHRHHAPMRTVGGGNGETRAFFPLRYSLRRTHASEGCLVLRAGLAGRSIRTDPDLVCRCVYRFLGPRRIRSVPGEGASCLSSRPVSLPPYPPTPSPPPSPASCRRRCRTDELLSSSPPRACRVRASLAAAALGF